MHHVKVARVKIPSPTEFRRLQTVTVIYFATGTWSVTFCTTPAVGFWGWMVLLFAHLGEVEIWAPFCVGSTEPTFEQDWIWIMYRLHLPKFI